MADISVRRDGGQLAAREWDPFRMMREMLRWDPFREMAPVLGAGPAGFYPAFDIKETKDGFVFRADLPGIGPRVRAEPGRTSIPAGGTRSGAIHALR